VEDSQEAFKRKWACSEEAAWGTSGSGRSGTGGAEGGEGPIGGGSGGGCGRSCFCFSGALGFGGGAAGEVEEVGAWGVVGGEVGGAEEVGGEVGEGVGVWCWRDVS